VVLAGGDGPGFAGVAAAAVLVPVNALAVPRLRRAQRDGGVRGWLARWYMQLGVATLLIGTAVALSWLVFLLGAGLVGAFGGGGGGAWAAFRVGSGALVGGVAFLLFWGFTAGQATVERTHRRFEIPGLDSDLDGVRIAQISDLHIGNGMEGRRLDKMVDRTNALDADLIVVTGDLFDSDPRFIEDGAKRLGRLYARHGVYVVLGNHDHAVGAEAVAEGLARHAPGLRVLRDEWVRLPFGKPLYLAGADDPGANWSGRGIELEGLDSLAAGLPEDGPAVLLVHRPEAFAQAARLGFPLVVSGHTHGGQLALPTPGGRYNLASIMSPYTRGVYRDGGTTLYVNRGLGVGGPALRINCPREIAVLELTPGG
jgi:predicted MPP superfamily phosphohydrolase